MKSAPVIGFPHPPQEFGGPGSFQIRLENALKEKGWTIVYAENEIIPDVILVVGGTKKHKWLRKCKKRGVRIVHRLDGMNWLHRIKKMPLKQKVIAEVRNRMTAKIRSKYADHIIYQSQFVKDWWCKVKGSVPACDSIIYNAVDLNIFKPVSRPQPLKLICVEGTIDYSPFALKTLSYLAEQFADLTVELYGNLENTSLKEKYSSLTFKGCVDRNEIHKVYNNGIYISLDVNAACPNTVIEAMASGVPVVGFDTGALKELIGNEAGVAASYGTDPWKLEEPSFENLKSAVSKVLDNFSDYCKAARKMAEQSYSIEHLTEAYIEILTAGGKFV